MVNRNMTQQSRLQGAAHSHSTGALWHQVRREHFRLSYTGGSMTGLKIVMMVTGSIKGDPGL